MGKCLTCKTDIPDGTTHCSEHKFKPGQTTKVDRGPGGSSNWEDSGGGSAVNKYSPRVERQDKDPFDRGGLI